ncbi:MAG: hypothetical protein EOO89_19525 [Pedobacter sp.]|nr:MAG: hypothetical protein EOO89_19525 [Pedobacter sp.]
MKKLFTTVIICSIIASTYGQSTSELKKKGTDATLVRFYYFELPSSINGSYIDPTPISNISSSFTESKLSVKLGFPSFFKVAPETKDLKWSAFIQPSFKASSGVSTLFKKGNPPMDFGLTGGISFVTSHPYWVYLDAAGNATTRHSSEALTWLNLTANIEQANYNLFNPNAVYGGLLNKVSETNGGLFLSLNKYFFSELRKHRWKSGIGSIGIGYAKTNDYAVLKKRILEEGRIHFNEDSSAYQTVVETTAGAIGPLTVYEGLAAYVEGYLPLIRSKKYGSVYFGNKLTAYAIGNSSSIINGNTGFYFNIKDAKMVDDKPAKDIVNFSITGQFNKLGDLGNDNYFDTNLTVLFQASVPLRFN